MKRNAALAAILLGASAVVSSTALFADTSITAAGSTALLPLVKDAAGLYQQQHPDVKISVSGGGSGTGINQAAAKAVDIGNSDILAPSHPELYDSRVAVIGFSVIVNPALNVKNLTRKQIQDLFSGKVTNWKDVGGPDQKVVLINRTRGSGTRVVFEKTVMAPEKVSEAGLSEDATGTVISVVKQTPGAISYAAFSGTKASANAVTEVSINGVAADEVHVVDGKYPFWSYEHMFTNGPPTGEVSRFIAFVQTHSELLKKNYFTRIADMKVKETDR
ncbi:MAG: phosphate ABC transporter substrate-binding protein [Isosphaeraceae bacterium]